MTQAVRPKTVGLDEYIEELQLGIGSRYILDLKSGWMIQNHQERTS